MPSTALAAKPRKLYWGAHIGDQLTGTAAPYDMGAVSKFAAIAGKGLSMVGVSAAFADCSSSPCTFYGFPTTLMEDVRQYGAIPFFTWASQATPPGGLSQPNFQLSDVISGKHDAYIRSFAAGAKSWGHPFFLRFNPEMNGNWFSWSERRNGNRRGESVAAWRHVHDIFTSVGATNATWVWCPNVNISDDSALQHNLRALYPGRKYVDWTCLDGFNWGLRAGSPGWLSFKQIFRRTYRRVIKIAPTKPMVLGEVASSDSGGSKAAWIRNMLRTIPNKYRKIRGIIWNDVHDRDTNWPIETSRSATRAFRRGIGRRVYQPSRFANLAASPIRPPH
ncbi:MAG: glycosyl hydrolase [Actinomycetota bacterium]